MPSDTKTLNKTKTDQYKLPEGLREKKNKTKPWIMCFFMLTRYHSDSKVGTVKKCNFDTQENSVLMTW